MNRLAYCSLIAMMLTPCTALSQNAPASPSVIQPSRIAPGEPNPSTPSGNTVAPPDVGQGAQPIAPGEPYPTPPVNTVSPPDVRR